MARFAGLAGSIWRDAKGEESYGEWEREHTSSCLPEYQAYFSSRRDGTTRDSGAAGICRIPCGGRAAA